MNPTFHHDFDLISFSSFLTVQDFCLFVLEKATTEELKFGIRADGGGVFYVRTLKYVFNIFVEQASFFLGGGCEYFWNLTLLIAVMI